MSVKISSSRKGNPYQYLRHVWQFQFQESKRRFDAYDEDDQDAREQAEGWQKFKAAGFIFLAFWLEAYLNYVLSQTYSEEEYVLLERSSPIAKLKLFKVKYDLEEELSVFHEIFKFRNDLAHGKCFEVNFEATVDEEQATNTGTQIMGWEEFIKIDEKNIIQKAKKLCKELQNNSGVEWDAFGVGEIASFSFEKL